MATFILILKLFAALIGLFVILFFIYAMRWSVMEKQIRKALEAEFKNRTDQALDLIKRENEANEIAFQEKQADLMKKRDEAEAETAQSEAEMPVEETPTEEAPAIEVEQPAAEEVAPEETEAEEPAEQPEEAVEPAFGQ